MLGDIQGGFNQDRRFPGFLWDLPTVLSLRVTGVHAIDSNGAVIPLRWTRDPGGRLYIPPQAVSSAWSERPSPAGGTSACWLVVEVPLGPGELRHCGRAWLNVAVARPRDPRADGPIAPGTIVAPADLDAMRVTVEQPFAGWPGMPDEDPTAAEQRLACTFRHRGRAVTADDLADLLRDRWPIIFLLDVSPTRVRVGSVYHDAIRLTIVPRTWQGPADLLAQALLLADRAVRYLTPKVAVGVRRSSRASDVARPGAAGAGRPPLALP